MGSSNGVDPSPPERFYRAEGGSNVAGGGSVYQYETLGKAGLIVFLVMFVVIAGLAVLAGYSLGVGEARAENTATEVRRLNAKVEVLQWEFDKASAQLIEKGLITPPE